MVRVRFIDKPSSIFLEIEDILGIKYYYKLITLYLGTQSSNGMALHTISEIKNISRSGMEKIIKENN